MPLTAKVNSSVAITQTGSGDLDVSQAQVNQSHSLVYSDGAAAGQANLQWTDRRTLAASANESLDFAGSLANALGATVFARIKYIRITSVPANVNNINVTRPASNGWPLFLAASDGLVIPPGGKFEWGDPGATGVAVTAGTGDLLNIANAAGSTTVDYDIIVIGAAT